MSSNFRIYFVILHNMKRFTYNLYLLLFASSFLAMGVSCQSEVERKRITQEERRAAFVEDSLSFKVGILPTADCDFIRMAGEKTADETAKNMFDSLGVTVHLKHYKALSECRYALNHGMVEAAVVDSVLAKEIMEKDSTGLLLSVPTNLSWKLISAKKARVLRTSQLVDKIIAVDSHGMSHQLAEQAVDSLIRKQQQVFFVQVEDPKVRYDMLRVGNVDAAMLPEPFASKALSEGHKLLKDYTQKSYGVIVFRKKVLEDKRIAAQKDLFLKALEMAKKKK